MPEWLKFADCAQLYTSAIGGRELGVVLSERQTATGLSDPVTPVLTTLSHNLLHVSGNVGAVHPDLLIELVKR